MPLLPPGLTRTRTRNSKFLTVSPPQTRKRLYFSLPSAVPVRQPSSTFQSCVLPSQPLRSRPLKSASKPSGGRGPGWPAASRPSRVSVTAAPSRASRGRLWLFMGLLRARGFTVDREWLRWNGGLVPRLARRIQEEDDGASLPILGGRPGGGRLSGGGPAGPLPAAPPARARATPPRPLRADPAGLLGAESARAQGDG